jgi:uncharacterized membrane protein
MHQSVVIQRPVEPTSSQYSHLEHGFIGSFMKLQDLIFRPFGPVATTLFLPAPMTAATGIPIIPIIFIPVVLIVILIACEQVAGRKHASNQFSQISTQQSSKKQLATAKQ